MSKDFYAAHVFRPIAIKYGMIR